MVSGTHDREEPAARYDGGDLDLAGGLMFALDVCLSDIAPGEMLELSSANAGLAHELPAWCRGTGHELVASQADGGRTLYRIRRGAHAALMFKDLPDWGIRAPLRTDGEGFDTKDWLVGQGCADPGGRRRRDGVLAARCSRRGGLSSVPVHGERARPRVGAQRRVALRAGDRVAVGRFARYRVGAICRTCPITSSALCARS